MYFLVKYNCYMLNLICSLVNISIRVQGVKRIVMQQRHENKEDHFVPNKGKSHVFDKIRRNCTRIQKIRYISKCVHRPNLKNLSRGLNPPKPDLN